MSRNEKQENENDFAPQYDPKVVEDRIYKLWEEGGFFAPENLPERQETGDKRRAFCVVVPPPNITGSLHMGHALNATIQDILIRKKRMEGYRTLWLPGTDHAGIATQNVVEKDLKKQGLSRHDLGREKFLASIWEWKEKYGDIILNQFRKLGASMDWSRLRFTMDEAYQKAVQEAFLHYYKKELLYRAERVINWCVRCQTSLSDLELEYQEAQDVLYYIKYPIAPDSAFGVQRSKFITVATVRPETMLGDSAVAVNPEDLRYKDFVRKKAMLPIQNREIPIIADEHVELEFGTGAVKVTPAHDFADADMGERHKLPFHKIIDERGKMTGEAGAICEGLKIGECRERVIAELKKEGLIEKEEPYRHNISVCYRCATVIEPLPSMQWFLKMKELAKLALDAAESGKVRFHPERWKEVYVAWLKNVRDWNVSRQIWWGHRIPVWYCVGCGETRIQPDIIGNWFFVRHGETDWNVAKRIQGQTSSVGLNENGRAQVRAAAEKLKNYSVDLVVSSDLQRAEETAEILAKELGVEIILDQAFRERNYGAAEGLTYDEVRERGFGIMLEKPQDKKFKLPGGESLQELEDRVHAALLNHRDRHIHKNVVIVSHGAVLKSLLRCLKNATLADMADMAIHNASIVHFSVVKNPCKKCGTDFVEQDSDVLDTWFSSALWPFATLGWPAQCEPTTDNQQLTTPCVPKSKTDLAEFYPTQVLSTARDIINLWVGRMMFSGLEFMNKEPFSDVIIHATILTKDGKRMSKSLGTGIDPMTLVEKYGADATRFGLVWQAMGGQDVHWSEEHVIAGKKFCNKIWNSARFVLLQMAEGKEQTAKTPVGETDEDKKILERLESVKKEVSALIDSYEFGQALHILYDFFWHEFCDNYLETAKKQLKTDNLQLTTQKILLHILAESLKLLHPFMPFITEEVWTKLPIENKKMLIIESWPRQD